MLVVVLVELDEFSFEVLLMADVVLELVEKFVLVELLVVAYVVLELSALGPPIVVVVFVDVALEEAFDGTK